MSGQHKHLPATRRLNADVVNGRRALAPVVLACLLAAPAWAQSLAPVANPGGPYLGNHNSPIVLDGSNSFDPNGLPLTFAWDLTGTGNYTDSALVNPVVTYPVPGAFPVCLMVSDSYRRATGCTTVTVGNRVPIASAGGPYLITLGSGFALDASGSFDPDGDPLSYAWDLNADGRFGDLSGAHATLSAADSLARFAAPGTYNIAIMVTDAFGASDIRHTALNVSAVPEPATAALFLAGLLAVCARTARGRKAVESSP